MVVIKLCAKLYYFLQKPDDTEIANDQKLKLQEEYQQNLEEFKKDTEAYKEQHPESGKDMPLAAEELVCSNMHDAIHSR